MEAISLKHNRSKYRNQLIVVLPDPNTSTAQPQHLRVREHLKRNTVCFRSIYKYFPPWNSYTLVPLLLVNVFWPHNLFWFYFLACFLCGVYGLPQAVASAAYQIIFVPCPHVLVLQGNVISKLPWLLSHAQPRIEKLLTSVFRELCITQLFRLTKMNV